MVPLGPWTKPPQFWPGKEHTSESIWAWPVFKVFFVKFSSHYGLFFFFFFVTLSGLEDLSSPTRDWTWAMAVKSRILNTRHQGTFWPVFIMIYCVILHAQMLSDKLQQYSLVLKIENACVLSHAPTLCNPMDCNPPGSSIHGNFPDKNTRVG